LSFLARRYFNAAGADPDGEIGECHVPETHAIPLLLEAAAERQKAFTIFGDDYPTTDGTCVRDYVHVSDLADAHVRAVRAVLDGAESAVFNLGTGHGWSLRQLVDTAGQIVNREVPVTIGPRRAGDPPVLVADANLARTRLDWRPRYPDLATQIKHAWVWQQGPVKAWKRMEMKVL
jgi:UDP-glucose 4-epimerase